LQQKPRAIARGFLFLKSAAALPLPIPRPDRIFGDGQRFAGQRFAWCFLVPAKS